MSKLYEKWKPTYQAKHNRTVIGDDYVHLISNRTNRESILIAGENDVETILTIISLEWGMNVRLFYDAPMPPILSHLIISDM